MSFRGAARRDRAANQQFCNDFQYQTNPNQRSGWSRAGNFLFSGLATFLIFTTISVFFFVTIIKKKLLNQHEQVFLNFYKNQKKRMAYLIHEKRHLIDYSVRMRLDEIKM